MDNRKSFSLRNRANFLLSNKFKAVTTVTLSLIAILLCILKPSVDRRFIALAIVTSTVADFILMNIMNIPKRIFNGKNFYVGMAVFCVVHVIYTIFFLRELYMKYTIYQTQASAYGCIIILIYSLALGVMFTYEKSTFFKTAVSVYIAFICASLFSVYACLEVFGGMYWLSAIGMTSFFISDFFILLRETVCPEDLTRKLIWIFYPIGQLLIMFSVI